MFLFHENIACHVFVLGFYMLQNDAETTLYVSAVFAVRYINHLH